MGGKALLRRARVLFTWLALARRLVPSFSRSPGSLLLLIINDGDDDEETLMRLGNATRSKHGGLLGQLTVLDTIKNNSLVHRFVEAMGKESNGTTYRRHSPKQCLPFFEKRFKNGNTIPTNAELDIIRELSMWREEALRSRTTLLIVGTSATITQIATYLEIQTSKDQHGAFFCPLAFDDDALTIDSMHAVALESGVA